MLPGSGLPGAGTGIVAVLIAAGVTSLPRSAGRICVLLRVVLLNDLRNFFLRPTLAEAPDIPGADTPDIAHANDMRDEFVEPKLYGG
jgi:hypothetical protein